MMRLLKIFLIISLIPLLYSCAEGSKASGLCGDNTVSPGEDCDPPSVGACGSDCLRDVSKCGDGLCENPETHDNCSDDCDANQTGCGNNVREMGEDCDGSDLHDETCETQGFGGGTLACNENCKFDTTLCDAAAFCGNGSVDDSSEECDVMDLNGETCETQGFAGGNLKCNADCSFDTSSCIDPSCGNNTIEGSEECDGTDLNGQTCSSMGNYNNGDLKCSDNCTLDISGCGNCSNGIMEGDEECDGTDWGSKTCQSVGFDGGDLGCSTGCVLDTTGCTTCGDGVVDGNEQCDLTQLNGQTCVTRGFAGGDLACSSTCFYDESSCYNIVCGDGVINGSEECEGSDLNGHSCASEGFAGGTLICDSNCNFDTSNCTNCGNNVINGSEECDNSDFGSHTCQTEGFDSGSLSCNLNCTLNTSSCSTFSCGNGIIEGNEECEGSNLNGQSCSTQGFDGGTLSCQSNCSFNTSACYRCGDGVANGSEQCDQSDLDGQSCTTQGFTGGSLSCNSNCTFNTSACTSTVCGNGTLDSGEECDDGNTSLYDGCGSTCQVEDNFYLPVRLIGGEGTNEGKVEVHYNGNWEQVCDDIYDSNQQQAFADVVCSMLGFTGTGHQFFTSYRNDGNDTFLMDDVHCTGSETSLAQCPFLGWYNENCSAFETAGVRCMPGEGDVRLVNGPSGMEGMMEIYHNGTWGEICDDNLENSSEHWYGTYTFCHQMGYKFGSFLDNTYVGTDNYHLDNVQCNGTETRITDCAHNAWDTDNCGAAEAAGARCEIWTEGDVRITDGPNRNEGRLDILHNNIWGTICDDLNEGGTSSAGQNFISVGCQELGYTSTGSIGSYPAAYPGNEPTWKDNVNCSGTETDIVSCPANAWRDENCSHNEDIILTCSP